MRLSCCMTGEDSLLIPCGNRLLAGSHRIELVISACKKVQAWALINGIRCLSVLEEIHEISLPEVDYIFSIANGQILPDAILKLPRYGVINYHDSLLPRYAGVNAPSWAIMHGEREHGITWHQATQVVDAGDILWQQRFAIPGNATALLLNMLCYEAAISTFGQLLGSLTSQAARPVKQRLEERTVFTKATPLPNHGFMDWDAHSADDMDRMFRALQFGHYPNPLGTLQWAIGEACYVVTALELSAMSPDFPGAAGQIVHLDEAGIHVQTRAGAVRIVSAITTDGERLTGHELAVRHGLRVGGSIPRPCQGLQDGLFPLLPKVIACEPWWISQLQEAAAHRCFDPRFSTEGTPDRIREFDIPLPELAGESVPGVVKPLFAALVMVYLFRLNDHDKTTLHIQTCRGESFPASADGFLARHVPCIVGPARETTFREMLLLAERLLQETRAQYTFRRDIFFRNPVLQDALKTPAIIIESQTGLAMPDACVLRFSMDAGASAIRVSHRLAETARGGAPFMLLGHAPVHFQNLLRGFCHAPDVPLATWCFLSGVERKTLMTVWGQGERRDCPFESLATRFERIAGLYPDRIAVRDCSGVLTYAQLLHESHRIAAVILGAGIRPGTGIGILLERNRVFLAVFLGILRARCWYVPLEVRFPPSKLASLVRTAGLRYLFTHDAGRDIAGQLGADMPPLHCFVPAALPESVTDLALPDLPDHQRPDDPAYVIFTSGTSGVPKGVMASQQNVLNYCRWFTEMTELDMDSTVDFSASIAFDLSVPCSIAPLLVGACVALCDESVKANPASYLRHLLKHGVTHVEATPGYLELLLQYPDTVRQLDRLRYLLLGADTVRVPLVRKWLELCPGHRVINEYGPTEATVSVTAWQVDAALMAGEHSVPIGRPGFNSSCYILDKQGNICPSGMMGELYIGGAQVVRGYLGRDEETAARFGEFSLPGAGRLYRTGDFACWLPSGNLQFLGREDDQIKFHGYRIELSEIESVLMSLEGVRQVLVWADAEATPPILVACLVCDAAYRKPELVREHLIRSLPRYMIPGEILFLDAIPLRENEKIDFSAIDRIRQSAHSLQKRAEPGTLREALQAIWESLFQSPVYPDAADFFELGGDSLAAVKLVSLLKSRFGMEISLQVLFDYPTFEQFANYVQSRYREPTAPMSGTAKVLSPIVSLGGNTQRPPLFLVHPAGGTVFVYKPLASALSDHCHVLGIQDENPHGDALDFGTLEAMASCYAEAIRNQCPGERVWLGGASFGATVAFQIASQLQSMGMHVDFLGLLDGWVNYPESVMAASSHELLRVHANRHVDMDREECERLLAREARRKELLLHYRPKPLDARVVLFKAETLWPEFLPADCPDNGWGAWCCGGLRVERVPGDHFSMLEPAHVRTLAGRICKYL